jgi:hypothetical protein
MVSNITLEFPEFITHIPQSKSKWIKIGYNRIYASGHHMIRSALVAAMHGYIEKHIPPNLNIQTPVETHLTVYVPKNFGNVKRLKNKASGKYYISWKPARDTYVPNWDIGNLAMIWLKCLDDVLIKKGLLPEDTVEFLRKTTYEYQEVATLKERKLIYEIKSIKK